MESDGNTRTMPIYQKFVEQAKELNPAFIAMVIPSRWMVGGLGLSDFRRSTLDDRRFRALVDFPKASEVFPGVEIKGGVSYFLWDRDNPGTCRVTTIRGDESITQERELNEFDVFVRDGKALDILHKVLAAGGPYMSEALSARTAFGLYSNFVGYHSTKRAGDVKYYATSPRGRVEAWVPRTAAVVNKEAIDRWKALIPEAGSDGGQRLPDIVLGQPWVAEPPSICTQSFIFVSVDAQEEAESVCSYYRTRFLRFLVSLRKITQHTTRDSYLWVPQQTWDREWTDAELYEKYTITEEEQAYIAEMVKEMPA